MLWVAINIFKIKFKVRLDGTLGNLFYLFMGFFPVILNLFNILLYFKLIA